MQIENTEIRQVQHVATQYLPITNADHQVGLEPRQGGNSIRGVNIQQGWVTHSVPIGQLPERQPGSSNIAALDEGKQQIIEQGLLHKTQSHKSGFPPATSTYPGGKKKSHFMASQAR